MNKLSKTFAEVIKVSSPKGGRIIFGNDTAIIKTIWSQTNIERKSNQQSETVQFVDLKTSAVTNLTSVDISTELLTSYSLSNDHRAVIRDIPSSGNGTKNQHLELWKGNVMKNNLDLSNFHGDVCNDGEFGCFEFSPCGNKLLYIAEKKKDKTEPYLPIPDEPKENTIYGGEYEYLQDWGETLVGKYFPMPYIFNEKPKLVECSNDFSYGQCVWGPNGEIVCVAWKNLPRKLGLVYCTNRESYIAVLKNGNSEFISSENCAVRSPKFSKDGKTLIWLEREAGGPHHGANRLMKYDWSTKTTETVVPIVYESMKTSNGLDFYGLYCLSLGDCWLSDNKTIVISTPQRASVRSYAINTETNQITDITKCDNENESTGILCARDNLILAWTSSMIKSTSTFLGIYNEGKINWIQLFQSEVTEDCTLEILRLQSNEECSTKDFNAIFFGPKNGSNPLIVWPHGGPHSVCTNTYNILASYFTRLGFATLLVNYRGSIGSGQNSVDFLPGRVGSSDVSDVHQATLTALEKYKNLTKCLLFGGSHGGFLVLHLAGQYPLIYSCAVALNPVTDLTAFSASDIPDWAMVEAGYKYSWQSFMMNKECFEEAKSKSPMIHIKNVKCPILMLVGKKDLRVPPSQGINYHLALKVLGVKTKMLVYEDNHSLKQTPHDVDVSINSAKWFMEHLAAESN